MKKKKYYKRDPKIELLLCCVYGVVICLFLKDKMNLLRFEFTTTYIIRVAVILPMVIFVFSYKLFSCFKQLGKRQVYLNSTLEMVDSMSGEEFEEFLKAHFEKMGYKVLLTPKSNDYGIDLICRKRKAIEDDCENGFVVQAKRYKGKVGVAAVQQVIAGTKYYGCKYGMVITNSYFTKNAWELAQKSGITLWDRNVLHEKFKIQHLDKAESISRYKM